MHTLWHWLLWMLAATSSDPADLAAERARGAGCVTVAYAAFAKEPAPPPEPAPQQLEQKPKAAACEKCGGTGRIYRPDGGYVRCSCGACSSGRCPAKVLP
jgi:hypothetical protein